MKSPRLLFLSIGLAIAWIGPAAAQYQSQPAPQTQSAPPATQSTTTTTAATGGTVKLLPPNKQGPTASADVAQQGDNVVITLHAPADETTAAVFSGTCANGKPQVSGPATPLQRLSNGTSQTTLPHAKVADLTSTPHAIVVQGGNVAPLCGDVSTITTGAPPPPKR